jgi:hypothetical protein
MAFGVGSLMILMKDKDAHSFMRTAGTTQIIPTMKTLKLWTQYRLLAHTAMIGCSSHQKISCTGTQIGMMNSFTLSIMKATTIGTMTGKTENAGAMTPTPTFTETAAIGTNKTLVNVAIMTTIMMGGLHGNHAAPVVADTTMMNLFGLDTLLILMARATMQSYGLKMK